MELIKRKISLETHYFVKTYIYIKDIIMKKLNTHIIIEKFKIVHGNKYDYSEVYYKNNKTKVTIICPEHGEFKQSPNLHLSGSGCPKCGNLSKVFKNKVNIKNFRDKVILIHGNKYDYSLVKIGFYKDKVTIICPEHGEFKQSPKVHLNGSGCPKCSGLCKYTTEEFIKESNIIHKNKYNYRLSNYINAKTKIKITCPTHGLFEQSPNPHLNGQGCPKCAGKNKTTDEIVTEFKLIHGNKYDYSEVEYKHNKLKVKIKCLLHGVFSQKPYSHLSGQACPKCRESKGEKIIRVFLDEHKINYESQKKFSDCKNFRPLPFDFYLPDYNICIEFDGIQHSKAMNNRGGIEAFNGILHRDAIKTKYCLDKGIKLIRINYNDDILTQLNNIL